MKLKELKEMHFKKIAVDTFGYAQTWATWKVEGEGEITIYLVEGNTALIQFSFWNDETGKENNKWLTRKVKDGRIQFNGEFYLTSYPGNEAEKVEVAADPVESEEPKKQLIADKLKELFGTNIVIKNKQVQKIVDENKLTVLKVGYMDIADRITIVLDKKATFRGCAYNETLYVKELEDGSYWIQK